MIQGVLAFAISKLDEHEARGRFKIKEHDYSSHSYNACPVIHAMTPLADDKNVNPQNQELCIILMSYSLVTDTKTDQLNLFFTASC